MNKTARKKARLLSAALSLALTGTSLSAVASQGTETGEAVLLATCKRAQQLMAQGKNVEAKALLEKAVRHDPNKYSPSIHELLADANQSVGNVDNAIAEYHKALNFEPGLKSATWNLALSYKDAGRFDEAAVWARRFLALSPAPQYKQQALRFIEDIEKRAASGEQGEPYFDVLARSGQLHPWSPSQFPLRIFVQSGVNITGYQEAFDGYLADAFKRWAEASNGRIAYRKVDNPVQANLTIAWTNDPRRVATTNGAVVEQGVAVTEYSPSADGISRIERGTIIFLTVDPTTGKAVNPAVMQTICLHEVGHVLGLNGHSGNPSDIMFYSSSGRQLPALSKNDKAAIAGLYAQYPVLIH